MRTVDLASVYCRDDLHENRWDDYLKHLTSDEARRIAEGSARLPDFLIKWSGFEPRRKGKQWSPARPYHVALEDCYIRENWDQIDALCKFNRVPFDATDEMIGAWRVYEFATQLDALMFWDEFNGCWIVGDVFIYPRRPNDLPKMKRPANWGKVFSQPHRE